MLMPGKLSLEMSICLMVAAKTGPVITLPESLSKPWLCDEYVFYKVSTLP